VIPGEFTVTIHARDESWVSITVDGKAISSEVVAAVVSAAFEDRKRSS